VKKVEGQRVTVFEVIDSINGLKTNLMFNLQDCLLPSAVQTNLGKLETDGKLPQEEVQKFHTTALSIYETALSYLKKLTEKRFVNMESYSWVTLNSTPSWANIERTSSLVIKTAPSVQFTENKMYDEYVDEMQFVTGGKSF
jgi:hypothetical protein